MFDFDRRRFGQSKDYFASRKKARTIQCDYRKRTHTRVFSQTLAHGNSQNEIRQRTQEGKKRGVSMESSKLGTTTEEVKR